MNNDVGIMRKGLQHLWSLGILAILGSLAYWGHANHWKIPSFNSLLGDSSPGKDKDHTEGPRTKSTGDGSYPLVEFGAIAQIQQAGIECEPVLEKPLDHFVQASATVGYNLTKIAQLSSRVPGSVWKVNVHVGQPVQKGDVLGIVDAAEVGQAKGDFLQDYSANMYATKRLNRLHSLAKEGAISDATLREAEKSVLETRLRRINSQQKLLNLGFELNLTKEEEPEELARRIQFLGLPNHAVDLLKDSPPKTANLIPFYAPFDGVITQFDCVVGEWLTPERTRVAMADVRTMWINLAVRKEDADRLALDQPIYFTSASRTKSIEGRLIWISTEIEEKTRTVQARALVHNTSLATSSGNGKESQFGPWLLRANEYGHAKIKVHHIPQAVMVPSKAIQRLNNKSLVFVACSDGKSFEARDVELGETDDRFVHVRSGVRAGESVVTTNSFVLKSELMKDTLVAQ